MHRHGYKGRKFGRERDQRRALLKGLASALIERGSIKTTLPKAKEVVPYTEKLITKAKKGDLHSRRQVIAKLANPASAHKLVDEIAPKLTKRTSGHLRIDKDLMGRRGDNAAMATVTFVDELNVAPVAKKVETDNLPAVDTPKLNAKSKKTASAPEAAKRTATQSGLHASDAKTAGKRTGRRGNR
ncbi:50S ribosomal protein L17 [Candidatus Saccharibacteria bacterium]|nr:50S ribosomal protein L17 [Candidatus Saccharibacteria bacterium]MCB9821532.1 50S ribosomal protein L17 [Candidatus Nomurabacteria bacterium]